MNSFSDYLAQGNAWWYVPAAVVLGALHGLEPGHSKTLMAAFIIAIRGTVGQAVLLGVSATISHTAIIWILAFVGLHYAGRFNLEEVEPYLQLLTGVVVIAMAGWMFVRTRREQQATEHHHHHEGEADENHGAHGGELLAIGHNEQIEISVFETEVPPRFRLYFYGHEGKAIQPPAELTVGLETSRPDGSKETFAFIPQENYLEATSNLPEPHEFNLAVKVSRSGAMTTHSTKFVESHHHHGLDPAAGDYEDAHQREHGRELQERFASGRVTTKQLVLFGLTGGLLPCPSAFAVLLICLQLKQFTLGFAIVLAFSLGLAFTLVTVGALAALSVRHATKRFKGFEKLARKMPYVSSAVMVGIGLVVGIQGLRHLLH